MESLAVFRALGDSTRYAIYCQIARSPVPVSTSELAASLNLHPNTVRPHLERLREAGLLEVERESRGTVGRPQHRYQVAAGAHLAEPQAPAQEMLAEMLADLANELRAAPEDVVDIGRRQGRRAEERSRPAHPRPCVQALQEQLVELGFEPTTAGEGADVTVTFMRCPFRQLAEAHPEVVCELHRGLVEGIVDASGGAKVAHFATLSDHAPCRVELAVG